MQKTWICFSVETNSEAATLLKIGKHYINVAGKNAARPSYRWNVQACENALSIPPEKR